MLIVIPNEDRGVDWEVLEARLICWLFIVLGGEVIVVGVVQLVGFKIEGVWRSLLSFIFVTLLSMVQHVVCWFLWWNSVVFLFSTVMWLKHGVSEDCFPKQMPTSLIMHLSTSMPIHNKCCNSRIFPSFCWVLINFYLLFQIALFEIMLLPKRRIVRRFGFLPSWVGDEIWNSIDSRLKIPFFLTMQ